MNVRMAKGSRRRFGVLSLLALSAACNLGTDAPRVKVTSAQLLENTALVRTLRLTLDHASDITVEYWADGTPRLRVRSAEATRHDVVLAQLRPGRTAEPLASIAGEEIVP